MKKITTLMLGLSLALGAASMFAQDKAADPKTDTTTKTKKAKKHKKAADKAAAEKKS